MPLYKAAILSSVIIFAPIAVYGYASSIDVMNANWKTKTLSVCILNNADQLYEDLFIDAVNTWSRSWTYLNYNFGQPSIDNCNVNVFIVNAYADLTSKGHLGVTDTRFQPGGGIIKSDILIPTQIEDEDGSIYTFTSTIFYRIALHEFGHALGLRHTIDENYEEPVDIMAPFIVPDDEEMLISNVDIQALNKLYDVETEFVPPQEREIEPLPPPSELPQVLVDMDIGIDRAVYYNNETLRFAVKPPTTVRGIEATVLLYPPEGRDRIVIREAADPNGVINVEVPLQGKELGIWTVKVSYVSWASETAFALKDAGPVIEIEPPIIEFSINVDKLQYSHGDAVAIFGTADKQSGWWLEIIDSEGKLFKRINSGSMKFNSDGTYQAIFMLVGDQLKSVGTWKIRLLEGTNPTVEKSSVTFDVASPIIEETKLEHKEADISVAMKTTKKLTLLAVKNNDDIAIYGIKIKAVDDIIRFVKVKGWNREKIEADTVMVWTEDRPITGSQNTIVLLILGNQHSDVEWTALDSKGRILSSSDISARPSDATSSR